MDSQAQQRALISYSLFRKHFYMTSFMTQLLVKAIWTIRCACSLYVQLHNQSEVTDNDVFKEPIKLVYLWSHVNYFFYVFRAAAQKAYRQAPACKHMLSLNNCTTCHTLRFLVFLLLYKAACWITLSVELNQENGSEHTAGSCHQEKIHLL